MADPAVRLRKAEQADAERLLTWRNDPTTRRNSLDQAEIRLDQHLVWLERQLSSPDVALYIIEDGGRPCGQVRLNRLNQGGALISIGLARESQGRGLGAAALREVQRPRHRPPWASTIYAVIKEDNAASSRAFEAAGFLGPSEEGAAVLAPLEEGTGVWTARPDLE